MKVVVIGGTGRIGQHVVQKLTLASHEAISLDVVSAARSTGVDLTTGNGLERILKGAEVVINLTNSPTFDEASLDFFRTSMNNLLVAGASAAVRHQVVLSMVGVDRVPQLDYFRAKLLQEELLRQGPTPYSIVRATQFFEFMDTVISWTSDDNAVRLPSTRIQPVAAADVVDAVVEVALGPPLRGIRNVAGPDVFGLDELGRVTLAARGDGRSVISDDQAGMFAAVGGDELIAGPDAAWVPLSTLMAGVPLEPTHYLDWIQKSR
ncbi:MAG: SDR family oxidoreductase [Acidimicrobiaceae bacterium]|nr:SDR family oxidoreductase [Acidimicrobiaceae bacterium]